MPFSAPPLAAALLAGSLISPGGPLAAATVPAVITTLAAITPPAAAATPAAAPDPALVDCAGRLVSRPGEIAISCADGGIAILAIRWSAWTLNGARGSGRLVVNRCAYPEGPACVAGRTDAYPVTLSLGRLATGPLPSGRWGSVFTELELSFPEGGPIGFRGATYRIENTIR